MSLIYELLIKEKESLITRLDEVNKELENFQTNDKSVKQVVSVRTIIKNSNLKDKLEKASDSQKLLLILKEHQRFMRIREIGKYVYNELGGVENDWVIKLSRKTRNLKNFGKIIKIQVGKEKRNTFWGSPSWLDSNGNIKKEFMYKKEVINKNKKDELIDL